MQIDCGHIKIKKNIDAKQEITGCNPLNLHFALKICLFFPIHSTIPIKFIPRMLFGNFAQEVQGSYFVDR